jgi:hypothetical protein
MRAGFVRVSVVAVICLAGCAPVVPPPARDGENVPVLPPASQEKAITAFSFLQPPVTALIDERSRMISAAVPHGTEKSSLVAVFSTTGARVTVADTEQGSGVTINDFTDPVEYTVTAADGSTARYVVEVDMAPGQDKTLASFTLQVPGAASMIDEAQRIVRVRVPDGSNLSSLVAVFSCSGTEVRVSGRPQESGITTNDFTLPVPYEVIAEDGSSVVYTVQVTARIGLVINELDADQVGVDNAEFIELLALEEVDLWGIVVVLLHGGVTPGQEYRRIDLSALGTLPRGAYLVIAGPLVPVAAPAIKLTPPGWELTNRIQNGPSDAVVLWDALGHRVIDAVSYAGALHRAVITGEPGEVDACEGSESAPADSNTVTGSLGRSPNGADTGQNSADFKFINTLTPGAPNP